MAVPDNNMFLCGRGVIFHEVFFICFISILMIDTPRAFAIMDTYTHRSCTMKFARFKSGLIAVLALSLGACASSPRTPIYYVDAQVLKVERAPEVCRYKRSGGDGGALIGAIIGGVIGNQIGSGNGRKLATVAGVAIGAGAGAKGRKSDKMKCKRNGYLATVAYMHPTSKMYITTSVPLERHTRAKFIEIPVSG
jgi:outer membrane lipoprotein SlyB